MGRKGGKERKGKHKGKRTRKKKILGKGREGRDCR